VRLYVETMDAVLVEFDETGRVRFENEDWALPTLQERRAILFSAQSTLGDLFELVEVLGREPAKPPDA
jgi:hypothetical protein